MNIEWWMIDGAIGLIILFAALKGAARGIGDTILRIAGILGGLALGTVYSDRVAGWLRTTNAAAVLHDHIFEVIRGESSDQAEAVLTNPSSQSPFAEGGTESIISPDGDLSFLGSLSRSLGNLLGSAADKAAEEAAARLTEIAISIFSFVIILLGISVLMFIIRSLLRSARKNSAVIGFTDRTLGFVLGAVRGLLIAWVAVALLIPATTLFSPENVSPMIKALQQTTVAKVLYDVNPLLMLVKYVFKA